MILLPTGSDEALDLSGPFPTGILVDLPKMLSGGYMSILAVTVESANANDAEGHLAETPFENWDIGWHVPPLARVGRDLVWDVDDYKGTPAIPEYVARCTLTPRDQRGAECSVVVHEPGPGTELANVCLRELTVYFHPFGAGVAVTRATLTASSDLDPHGYKAACELASTAVASRLTPALQALTTMFCDALDKRYQRIGKSLTAQSLPLSHDPGVLLWVHRVIHLTACTANGLTFEQACTIAPSLRSMPTVGAEVVCPRRETRRFFPSIASSIVVEEGELRESPDEQIWRDALLDTVTLQNAYWAEADQIDSLLFLKVNEILAADTNSLASLENEAEKIRALQEEAILFRSLMAHHLLHLAPQDRELWAALARAWGLDELEENIDNKLGVFNDIYERVISRLHSKQNDRFTRILIVLTLASALTVFAVLIDFTQNHALTTPDALRFGLTLALVVGAVCFVIALIRRRG